MFPRLEILPKIVRPPVDSCFGTMPSQAPKSRPLENISPLPMVATVALEISGPMPGTVISRLHGASVSIFSRDLFHSLVKAPPIGGQGLNDADHAWRQCIRAFSKNIGQRPAQALDALGHSNAALKQEGPDLVHGGGSFRHQAARTDVALADRAAPPSWLPRSAWLAAALLQQSPRHRGNRSCGP